MQNGLETCRNVLKISFADPPGHRVNLMAYSPPSDVAALVSSLQSVYRSGIAFRRLFTNHYSLITSHGRTSGLAVRFQDLVLATSQGLDLGRFAVPAAFRGARNLDKISGS